MLKYASPMYLYLNEVNINEVLNIEHMNAIFE
jgi:hypothetical protein